MVNDIGHYPIETDDKNPVRVFITPNYNLPQAVYSPANVATN